MVFSKSRTTLNYTFKNKNLLHRPEKNNGV